MEYLLNQEVSSLSHSKIAEDIRKECCRKELEPIQQKVSKYISILERLETRGLNEQELDELMC